MSIFKKNTELSPNEQSLVQKVEILIQAVERVYPSQSKLVWRSFLSGIFFSLGTTVGFSLLVALATFLLAEIKQIPVVEQYLNPRYIEQVIIEPTPEITSEITPTETPPEVQQ